MSTLSKKAIQLGRGISKKSPTIFTMLGVGGLFTTVVLAVEATPKAMNLLDGERYRREKDSIVEGFGGSYAPITKKEVVQLTWKVYVPAAVSGILTAACVIWAHSLDNKRYAALATVYSLAQNGLREYQEKIIETIGEKKEKLVRAEISQDRLDRDPVTDKQVIMSGKGQTLFYDTLSGRYFKNDLENVRRIINDFNKTLLNEMYLQLNEFYDDLGLEHTTLGDTLGWSTEYGMLEVNFTAKIANDKEPCIVLNYAFEPRKL